MRGRRVTSVALRLLWGKDGSTIPFYAPTGALSAERGSSQSLPDHHGAKIYDRAQGELGIKIRGCKIRRVREGGNRVTY